MCVRGGAVCVVPPWVVVGGTSLTRAVQTLGGHRRTFRCTAWQDHGLRPTVVSLTAMQTSSQIGGRNPFWPKECTSEDYHLAEFRKVHLCIP